MLFNRVMGDVGFCLFLFFVCISGLINVVEQKEVFCTRNAPAEADESNRKHKPYLHVLNTIHFNPVL